MKIAWHAYAIGGLWYIWLIDNVTLTSVPTSPFSNIPVADIAFECTDTGTTSIQTTYAQLRNPYGYLLQDTPTDTNKVVQKKAKWELCLNLIKVKGKDGKEGTEITDKKIDELVKALEEELKKACCDIKIKKESAEIQDDNFKDGLKDEFSEKKLNDHLQYKLSGDEGDKADQKKDEIKLLTKHKDKRKEGCINVYFVKKLPESNGEQIRKHRTDKKGNKVEKPNEVRNKKDEKIKVDGKEVDEKDFFQTVIIGDNMLKSTFSHELMHQLGLEHNNLTDTKDDDGKDNQLQPCDIGTDLVPWQCEVIEKNVNDKLKPVKDP